MNLTKRDPRDILVSMAYLDRIMGIISDFGLKKADIGRLYRGDRDTPCPADAIRWFQRVRGTHRYSALLRLHLATLVTLNAGGGLGSAPIPTIVHPDGDRTGIQPPPAFVRQISDDHGSAVSSWSVCDTTMAAYMRDTRLGFANLLDGAGHTAGTLIRRLGYSEKTARLLTDPTSTAPWNYRLHQLCAVARSVGAEFTIL